MNIFYSYNIQSHIIRLDKVETNHCIKVLRNNIGDEVLVTDGMGFLYTCIIKEVKNKYAFLEIIKKKENKKKYFVHIAISPIKNHERLEWFVEKAVEIGIDRISFQNAGIAVIHSKARFPLRSHSWVEKSVLAPKGIF